MPSAQRSPLWPPMRPPATAPTTAPLPTEGRKICACAELTPTSAIETVTRSVFISMAETIGTGRLFSQIHAGQKNLSRTPHRDLAASRLVAHFASFGASRWEFGARNSSNAANRFNLPADEKH